MWPAAANTLPAVANTLPTHCLWQVTFGNTACLVYTALHPLASSTHPPASPTTQCTPQLKVLAVYGANDAMRSDFAALEDALPRSQFLLIPDAGHACYMDAPQLFTSELLRFLDNEVAA